MERQCDTTSINQPSLRAQHNEQHIYIQAALLKKHRHHDPPRPPASSDFKLIGECDLSTSYSGAQSLLHFEREINMFFLLIYNYSKGH